MSAVKLDILKDTFEHEFNIFKFKKFTREFFNEPEMLLGNRRTSISREYADHINSYYEIANYKDAQSNNLIVLAVELKKSTSVDRARSMQRNFISKVLDNKNLEAAIVAFYTEDEASWRLSFVRLDYTFTDKGIDLDLTPARRYSYLIGENEPNHTAQSQLVDIFSDDKRNPTLDEIEEAFSVEKVTAEFFNQYKEKYLELKEHLEEDPSFKVETEKLGFKIEKFSEQFAKKLMGQLAFLYFLQKKGWLGVRVMPKNQTFEMDEFKKIYNEQDKYHKDILKRTFRQIKDGKMKLSSTELFKLDDHEAGILSDSFVGGKYDVGWGNGNKTFIREIFEFCNNSEDKNFFDDYLEPFFYQALNKKRKNHYFKVFNCKIPFLNGGLFEPLEGYNWKDVKFEIPNKLFSNEKEKGREADGILDIFDRFNFTMNEAEPLDKEVAVDPEMLGKIFENLLDVKDRKSKGAFYTPREIVHYMCQESLVNYLVNEVNVPYEDMKEFILYGELIRDADGRTNVGYGKALTIKRTIFDNIGKIENALKKMRVADPAVGSGAFTLGMLNEIVRARNNITEYLVRKDKTDGGILDDGINYGEETIRCNRAIYELKWNTIKNSIFAVDIEPSAVDITKLRLWLSVVVDQEIDKNNLEPHPLPNLDMNIHVGNSLIDEYEGIKLFDKSLLEKDNAKKRNISDKKAEQLRIFFDSDEILQEMFNKQSQYFDETNEDNKKVLKNRIDTLRDELIVYKLKESGKSDALDKYNIIKNEKSKPYFIWELEFAKVFKEKGGFDIVIGNPPYGAKFDKKTKQYLSDKYPNVPDYESADYFICKSNEILNNGGIMSYIIPNTILSNFFAKKMRQEILDNWGIYSIDNLSDMEIFLSAKVRNCILTLQKSGKNTHTTKFINGKIINSTYKDNDYKVVSKDLLNKAIDGWLNLFYQDEETIVIIDKLRATNNKLGDLAEVSQGLIPYDKYRGHSPEIIKNRIWHADHKKDETYKKELQGRDLQRYYLKWGGEKWISYGEWLAAPRKPEFFRSERILIREITNPRILATYTQEEYYNSPSIINIIKFKEISPLYLLAIINSKLLSFYHNKTSPKANKGLFPKILVNDVRNLPIKVIEGDMYTLLVERTEDLIKQTMNNQTDNIQYTDAEIDNIVYGIYNLNNKEIKIVEMFFEERG